MAQSGLKILAVSSLIFLTACSGTSGDWPNLSDPLPDASERERVIERGQPAANSAPAEPERGNPMTVSVAVKLLAAVRADVENANKTYMAAKDAIAAAEGEEKEIAWHEAQLQLTRLSQASNKLDSIIYAEQLKEEAFWKKAVDLKNQQDNYVASERQQLNALKP